MAEPYPAEPRPAESHAHVATWRVIGGSYVVLGVLLLLAAADVLTPRWSVVMPLLVLATGAALVLNGARARTHRAPGAPH